MSTHASPPPILFDLDGTLVDTVYLHVMSWTAALSEFGVEIPSWKIHRRIGMSGKSLTKQLLREPEVRKRRLDLDKLESRHEALFVKASRTPRVLPGAQLLLNHLTGNQVRWAIATTGKQKQTKRLLQNLRLPKNTPVVTGDDVAQAKPSPDIFLLAAEKLDVPMEDCIVVGDAIWDMLAAGRRRALAIGLLTGGYSKQELEESGAFRVYADPADMLLHIEDLGIVGSEPKTR
jgi:HAD superfamily hydrolase (TIGR01509 family)